MKLFAKVRKKIRISIKKSYLAAFKVLNINIYAKI